MLHNVFPVLPPPRPCEQWLKGTPRPEEMVGGGQWRCRKSIPRFLWLLPKLTYTRGFSIKVSNIWLHKHISHYENTSRGVPCWQFKYKTFNYEHLGNQAAVLWVLYTQHPPYAWKHCSKSSTNIPNSSWSPHCHLPLLQVFSHLKLHLCG